MFAVTSPILIVFMPCRSNNNVYLVIKFLSNTAHEQMFVYKTSYRFMNKPKMVIKNNNIIPNLILSDSTKPIFNTRYIRPSHCHYEYIPPHPSLYHTEAQIR